MNVQWMVSNKSYKDSQEKTWNHLIFSTHKFKGMIALANLCHRYKSKAYNSPVNIALGSYNLSDLIEVESARMGSSRQLLEFYKQEKDF